MTSKVLTPLLKKGKDLSGAALKKVRKMDLGIVKKVENGIKNGVKKVKNLAATPLSKTGKDDLAGIVKDVTKNLKAKDGEVLKNFAQNLTNKGILENAVNGTISDKALKPVLDAAEKAATGQPQTTKATGKQKPAQAPSGFNSKPAGSGQQQARAKIQPVKPKKPKPKPKKKAKRRKETPKERKQRKADLMALAKRSAARAKNPDYKGVQNDSTAVIEQNCTIDTVVWHPSDAKQKSYETFYIRGGQVTATMDMTYNTNEYHKDNWACAPQRVTGTFSGSLMNNVISGTWTMKYHTHGCWHTWTKSTKDSDGKYQKQNLRCTYSNWGSSSMHTDTVLKMGHKLTTTYRGNHTSTTSWGAGCYKTIAGTTKTHSNAFAWNDPGMDDNYRKPMVGVWEKRKRPKVEDE